MTMTTEYEGLDLSEMQKEYERVNAEGATFNSDDYFEKFVKLPDPAGYVNMRLMPRKKGSKLYQATRVHTLINPAQKDSYGKPRKRTFHCPQELVQGQRGPSWKGDCIICKYYRDLWSKSESAKGKAQEDLQNQARAIKPVERYYYNVIVRSEKDSKTGENKKNVGPKIFSCGKMVHAKIMRAIVGDESADEAPLGDVTHPVTGRDFKLVKKVVKGTGGTEYPGYDNSKFEDVSPAGTPEELKTWLENLHDLKALRVLKTSDELKQALKVHLGIVKGESEDTSDLDEFRNVSQENHSDVIGDVVTESVREDLVTPTVKLSSDKSDLDILADDDFLKEMEAD